MKIIIAQIISGMRTGALVFLLIFWLNSFQIPMTNTLLISTIIGSGLMGLGNLIFDNQYLEESPFIFLLFLHFIFISIIYVGFSYFNQWQDRLLSINGLIGFVLIYLCIWIGVTINNYLTANQINKALEKRRTEKK